MDQFEHLHVSVTPQLARMVKQKVRTGRYSSASEVVREALRLLEKQDAFEKRRLELEGTDDIESSLTSSQRDGIRHRVQAAIDAIDRNDHKDYPGKQGLEQLRQELSARVRTFSEAASR